MHFIHLILFFPLFYVLSRCVQMCPCESGQWVNFYSGVNSSDLSLSGETSTAVEMEHLQPEGTQTQVKCVQSKGWMFGVRIRYNNMC